MGFDLSGKVSLEFCYLFSTKLTFHPIHHGLFSEILVGNEVVGAGETNGAVSTGRVNLRATVFVSGVDGPVSGVNKTVFDFVFQIGDVSVVCDCHGG